MMGNSVFPDKRGQADIKTVSKVISGMKREIKDQ